MKRRPTHYAEILAAHNRVINVSWTSMKDYFFFRGKRPWEEKIFFRLPGSRLGPIKRLNKWLYGRFLKETVNHLPKRPVLWHFYSGNYDLVKDLPKKLSILEICDDTPEFFADNPEIYENVKKNEDNLTKAADIVFTISDFLREKKKAIRPDIKVIRNGVVYEDFCQVPELARDPQDELYSLKPPIVGYTGAVSKWFDFELIGRVADSLPQVNFVFIGRIAPDQQISVQKLSNRPNIHFLGERPYEQLPQYMKFFDLAQIPFKINELILSVNPIKLYEYLAAGLRVVSTPLPEVARYARAGLIETADESREYGRAIEKMLAEKDQIHIKACQEIARQNSWQARMDAVCIEIEQKIVGSTVK